VKVQVKLLGTYRRHLPADAQGPAYDLELPTATAVEDLLAQLPVPTLEGCVVLVNGRTPTDGQVLQEGDTLAIFPAMAGG
jgi:molybdopterin converting factor small subunit